MERILTEESNSAIYDLKLDKGNKVEEYNDIVRKCNSYQDERAKLKNDAYTLKRYIDVNVEDRLEKITSVWALFTAIFCYDFLTFWGGEILKSFLITMFCCVPISSIIFYTFEMIFYDKIVNILSIFNKDLKKLYDEYDVLSNCIEEMDQKIEIVESDKKASYNKIVSIDRKIDKNNNKIINLNYNEPKKSTIVEGFTFSKKKVKRY